MMAVGAVLTQKLLEALFRSLLTQLGRVHPSAALAILISR